MPAIRLENWSMSEDGDAYTPPENRRRRLHGQVYGHPRFADGDQINTSNVLKFDPKERTAKTYSGSEYALGKPCPHYQLWCQEIGKEID